MLLGGVIIELGIVRMNADRCVNIVVFLSYGNGSLKIVAVRIAGPNIEHHPNTGIFCTLNHIVTVRVELLAVNMAVRVDQHYLSREPTFTSSKNVAIAGVSSCPSDAAQI